MNPARQRIVIRLWTSGWSSAEYLMETISRLLIFLPGCSGYLSTDRVSTIALAASLRLYLSVGEEDKCKLYCRVEYSSAYFLLASQVIDGTPCGIDTFDKCVGGQCVPAGCDHVLGSSSMLGELWGELLPVCLCLYLQTSVGCVMEMIHHVSGSQEHSPTPHMDTTL